MYVFRQTGQIHVLGTVYTVNVNFEKQCSGQQYTQHSYIWEYTEVYSLTAVLMAALYGVSLGPGGQPNPASPVFQTEIREWRHRRKPVHTQNTVFLSPLIIHSFLSVAFSVVALSL